MGMGDLYHLYCMVLLCVCITDQKEMKSIKRKNEIPDRDNLVYGYFVPLMGGQEATLEGPVCSSGLEIEHRIGPFRRNDGVSSASDFLLTSSCVLTWACS